MLVNNILLNYKYRRVTKGDHERWDCVTLCVRSICMNFVPYNRASFNFHTKQYYYHDCLCTHM